MKYYRLTRSTKSGRLRFEYKNEQYWEASIVDCPQNLESAKVRLSDLNTPEKWEVVEE